MMTSGERGFLILLIANLFIVCLYLLQVFWIKRGEWQESTGSILLKAAVMLLCPGVGPGFVALGCLCHRLVFYRQVDLEDVIFSKARIKPQMPAEEEQESNLVPVEEAVAITDKDSLRSMMLQVVRGEITESLSAISLALNSDDSEAAHYAAAALQSVLGEFRFRAQKNYEQIMKEKEEASQASLEERLKLSEETIDFMTGFMGRRLLADSEQIQYARMLEEIGDILFVQDASRLSAERLKAISVEQLEARDYEACRKWALRAYSMYPESAEGYICQLRLYFATREKEKFFRVLNELRTSDITIDKETLDLVRVFL